jgi:hypothetical protein
MVSVLLTNSLTIACFPLLRPIFIHILPNSFLSSYGKSSQRISRPSNAIKLTTLIRTNKNKESDDTSSTHQLADLEHGLSYNSVDIRRLEGVHTIISSQQSASGRDEEMSGIYVQNNTVVEINRVETRAFIK